MKTKLKKLFIVSNEVIIIALLLFSYFLSFELIYELGSAINSDLIYIESLFRDFFVRDYPIDGWLVSKAPYFFPDWPLYFTLRYFLGDYVTSWYLYIFILFLLVQLFLYKTILLFAPKKKGVGLFTVAWSSLLLIIAKNTPDGFGPLTFFLPVYHSGALILGLLILYLWLKSINNKINNITKLIIVITSIFSTVSDLWWVVWFLIPLSISTIFILITRQILNYKNILFIILAWIGSILGFFISKIIEYLKILNFSDAIAGRPYEKLSVQINSYIKDYIEILLSSPILLIFTVISLSCSVYILYNLIKSTLLKEKLNNQVFNFSFNNYERLTIFFIWFLITLIFTSGIICYFRLWEKWNYRYIFPFFVFPWILVGSLVFLKFSLSKLVIKIFKFILFIFACIYLIWILNFSNTSTFKEMTEGVPLAWSTKNYSETNFCIDKIAKLNNIKYGLGEYWEAKNNTETSREDIFINQITNDFRILHWMNNLHWYKNNNIDYDFIILEKDGSKELRQQINKFGLFPSKTFSCARKEIFIFKGYRKKHFNRFVHDRFDPTANRFNNLVFKLDFLKNNQLTSYPEKITKKKKYDVKHNKYFLDFNFPKSKSFSYTEFVVPIKKKYSTEYTLEFLHRTKGKSLNPSVLIYMSPSTILDNNELFIGKYEYLPSESWINKTIKFAVPNNLALGDGSEANLIIRPFFVEENVKDTHFEITELNLYNSENYKFNSNNIIDENYEIENKCFGEISLNEMLKFSDIYNKNKNFDKEYLCLKHIENRYNNSPELNWRLARVHSHYLEIESDESVRNTLIQLGGGYAHRGQLKYKSADNMFWWAYYITKLGLNDGMLVGLYSFVYQHHLLLDAINLFPENANLFYLYAQLNYKWSKSKLCFFNTKFNKIEICDLTDIKLARKYIQTAINLDPGNMEYKNFFESMHED